ncbi:MAG: alpha/beta fold hydrolase [Thiotrichales bacterium]|nr:MAG: alpha/beta fold hydrolase [Thiotrichales bacterium]
MPEIQAVLLVLKRLVIYLTVFVVGGLSVFVLGDLIVSLRLPELRPWHTITLNHDFTADMELATDWGRYLELEQKLFDELDVHLSQTIRPAIQLSSSRYIEGGNRFERRLEADWNRSYKLDAQNPKGVALMVHGLSDSPYSLRSIAQILNRNGVIVYGLRLPGHGTLPSGLDDVRWQDWYAAVRVVDRHIRQHHAELPYFFAGYSAGAALGVKLALDAVAEERMLPDQLLLFSPALGVNPLALLANLQRVLSHLEPLRKARWLDVLPEYDPYKYNSFTKNAGRQISLLVSQIYTDIERLNKTGNTEKLPAIVSFQSLVDATVSTVDLIDRLYAVINNRNSELVLFDVNQMSYFKKLIYYDPDKILQAFKKQAGSDYRLTLVTNQDDSTPAVTEITLPSPTRSYAERPLVLEWPEDVYSLSHTSITFPPDDPVYGLEFRDREGNEMITLGNLSIRGERGVLTVPAGNLLRLRSNPFFEYIDQRITDIILERSPDQASPERQPAQ